MAEEAGWEKFADEKEKEWELLDGSWKSMTRQLGRRKDQLQMYARYESLMPGYTKRA